MKILDKPQPWQVGCVLTLGVLSISTTAILIRLSMEASGIRGLGFSLFLAASRLAIAAIALLPTWRHFRKNPVSARGYYYAIGAGLSLAIHFAAWITSLSFTSIAASTTLVTTNPIWISLLSWWWFREKPTKFTVVGIVVALAGSVLIVLGDGGVEGSESNPLLGNCLALIGAWLVSLYLLFGREAQRCGFTLTNYVTLAYTIAALVLLPFPLVLGAGYTGYPKLVYVYVLLMAILSQLIGHTSFNWAIKWISPTLVTLTILFEPIGASFLGFLLLGEVPQPSVIWGGSVVLMGVAIAVSGREKEKLT